MLKDLEQIKINIELVVKSIESGLFNEQDVVKALKRIAEKI